MPETKPQTPSENLVLGLRPDGRHIGYARVSTTGQTLEAQLAQLRAARCSKIYREKASGAQADRRELQKLLKALEPGDVVVVTRIDRLARSTFDLFAIVKRIAEAAAQFCSLAEPWADTATPTGRLMLAVLGGLADVERDLIRTRTAEGRSRAQKRGQHMGRPCALTSQQQAEARQRREDGATLKELAQSYNVSRATVSRLCRTVSRSPAPGSMNQIT
jgi:DNA invertase Pin-like site-specific DNA recombinase